jgi:hypothetical protein
VLRYDGVTGAFEGVFASGGGLNGPNGLAFGTGGDLFVAGFFNDAVLRYDGVTGAFEGVFASGGGLFRPVGLTFGPDGDLFVVSRGTDQILRYDGMTGAFEGIFASGPRAPFGLEFGTDGDLFVTYDVTNQILRYDGVTGAFEGVFAAVPDPLGLTFGPGGDVFVSSRIENSVLRFDGVTGASEGVFASGGGLNIPGFLVFRPTASPAELIVALIEQVEGLNLHHGIENSLVAKLNAAFQALADVSTQNNVAAINALNDFINAVNAQRGKKIPAAAADALIAAALEIIELLLE